MLPLGIPRNTKTVGDSLCSGGRVHVVPWCALIPVCAVEKIFNWQTLDPVEHPVTEPLVTSPSSLMAKPGPASSHLDWSQLSSTSPLKTGTSKNVVKRVINPPCNRSGTTSSSDVSRLLNALAGLSRNDSPNEENLSVPGPSHQQNIIHQDSQSDSEHILSEASIVQRPPENPKKKLSKRFGCFQQQQQQCNLSRKQQ